MAMTLRLDEKVDALLTQVAEAHGISKQQAVVDAIERYLMDNQQKVIAKEAFDLVLTRDAKLLEKLSDA
jgi:hypothetical protein